MKTIIIFLGLILLAACQQDDAMPPVTGQDVPAVFIPTIGDKAPGTTSRAYDDKWEASDKVGVFMFNPPASGSEPVLGSDLTFRNIPYEVLTAGTSATLTAVGTAIKLPANDDPVRFIAYSPYTSGIGTDNLYPVDVTTQTSHKAIDLIYHKGTTNYTKVNPNVSLVFTHQLTKVRFTVEKDPNSVDFTPATTPYTFHLVGFPIRANLALNSGVLTALPALSAAPGGSGETLQPNFNAAASTAGKLEFEAIVIPHTGSAYANRSFQITIGTETFKYTFPSTHNLAPSQRYGYTFKLIGSKLILTGNTINAWATGASYGSTTLGAD